MKFLRYFCCLPIVWGIAFVGCGLKHNENMPHNSIHLQAKTDAESDAKRDVNSRAYFGVGMSVPFATGVCCLTGLCILNFTTESTFTIEEADDTLPCLNATVGTAAVFSTLLGYHIRSLNPPPERLIGKSPEYIMLYTDVYRAKMRWYRMRSVVAGSILGFTAAIIMFAIIRLYQKEK